MTTPTRSRTRPQIKFMTQTRQMPPWKADRRLRRLRGRARAAQDGDRHDRASGSTTARREGNPADLPPPIDFDGGWALGQPDLVLASRAVHAAADRRHTYRCFTMPTNLAGGHVRLGHRHHVPAIAQTVHHVIAFIDTTGDVAEARRSRSRSRLHLLRRPRVRSARRTLGGWAPGARPLSCRRTSACRCRRSRASCCRCTITRTAARRRPTRRRSAIYYAKKKPEQRIYILPLINQYVHDSAATTPNYEVTATVADPHAVPRAPLARSRRTCTCSDGR